LHGLLPAPPISAPGREHALGRGGRQLNLPAREWQVTGETPRA
jgi:hypothetical protein